MPTLARVFIKTGIIYLVLALLAGFLLLFHEATPMPALLLSFRPVYFHLFMVGWVTQLIFGVAWWMFPPISRERQRGKEAPFWFVYFALNVGLLLRAVSEPLYGLYFETFWRQVLMLSAFLQFSAAVVFVIFLWPRVKVR